MHTNCPAYQNHAPADPDSRQCTCILTDVLHHPRGPGYARLPVFLQLMQRGELTLAHLTVEAHVAAVFLQTVPSQLCLGAAVVGAVFFLAAEKTP